MSNNRIEALNLALRSEWSYPPNSQGIIDRAEAFLAFIEEGEATDMVNHPEHYRAHPSGVECITITRHMNFNLGNATKYLWRAGLKGEAVEDLRKAVWYIQDEILRIEGWLNKLPDEWPGEVDPGEPPF